MNLVDLKPRLTRFEGSRTFVKVDALADADSVWFLCPKCFAANGGPVGTHSIRIDFAGRGVPEDLCIQNSAGNAVYWNAAGTGLRDLSLTLSIQIIGGCSWHGFVTNGEIITC